MYRNTSDVTVFIKDYKPITHRFGKYLFRQDDESTTFYFIKSGTVEVTDLTDRTDLTDPADLPDLTDLTDLTGSNRSNRSNQSN